MHFQANYLLLSNRFPDLANTITGNDKKSFPVYHSPEGVTVEYQSRFLHSKHAPKREAERYIKARLDTDTKIDAAIFLGFGLGYTVDAYIAKNPKSFIIIFEPDKDLFLTALQLRDLQTILSFPKLIFIIDIKHTGIADLLFQINCQHPIIFHLRNSYLVHEEFFKGIEEDVFQYKQRKAVNVRTLQRFGHTWVRNLTANLLHMSEATGIDAIKNQCNKKSAILFAGGPSLDVIRPHLAELHKRFIFIAVDTSYRFLREEGFDADFLVVVDPQYWNTRHLDWTNPENTILVSESSTHPRIFRHASSTIYFTESLFPLGQYFESVLSIKGKLAAGGSVSTTALDLARHIGCDKVYCIGLDLGFPEYETHFKGSMFEERVHYMSSRLKPSAQHAFHALYDADPFLTENYDEKRILTDNRLYVYKNWFEQYCRRNPALKIYTLSENGVKIKGIHPVNFKNLFSQTEQRQSLNKKLKVLKKNQDTSVHNIRSKIVELLKALDELIQHCYNAECLCTSILQNGLVSSDYDKQLQELNKVDEFLLKGQLNPITAFLIQPIIEKINDTHQGENAIEVSKELYTDIRSSAEFHRTLLKKAHSALKKP